jgi:hypothetical protein
MLSGVIKHGLLDEHLSFSSDILVSGPPWLI